MSMQINPEAYYPVIYTVNQSGEKVFKPQYIQGKDLTEPQIIYLQSVGYFATPSAVPEVYQRTQKAINDLREYLHWNEFPLMLNSSRKEILCRIEQIETNLKNDYITEAWIEDKPTPSAVPEENIVTILEEDGFRWQVRRRQPTMEGVKDVWMNCTHELFLKTIREDRRIVKKPAPTEAVPEEDWTPEMKIAYCKGFEKATLRMKAYYEPLLSQPAPTPKQGENDKTEEA
jgi:hypothetical protein